MITARFVASPRLWTLPPGRWMGIVSNVRKIMWSDSERIWPLNLLGKSCRDQLRALSCDVHLRFLLLIVYFFAPSLPHMWSILQLTGLSADASRTQSWRQMCAHGHSFPLTRYSLSVSLRREGRGDIPSVALVLSMHQSPSILLQHLLPQCRLMQSFQIFIFFFSLICTVLSSLKAFLRFFYR